MSKFWSKRVQELDPYTPGEQPQDQQYIKLNTNENPYPPSPKAIQAMQSASDENMRLYPDPNCHSLKTAIADYYNIPIEQVFVGNSSDEVLAHTFVALLKHDKPLKMSYLSFKLIPTPPDFYMFLLRCCDLIQKYFHFLICADGDSQKLINSWRLKISNQYACIL